MFAVSELSGGKWWLNEKRGFLYFWHEYDFACSCHPSFEFVGRYTLVFYLFFRQEAVCVKIVATVSET